MKGFPVAADQPGIDTSVPHSARIWNYWLGGTEDALQVYEASGAAPYRTRSLEEFTSYFDGLELVDPGVVLVADWRPEPGADRGPAIPQIGAVGCKK
jgi:S-adenosyl methyltransferase